MSEFHFYGSPGPFGVSCCPGPRGNPHTLEAKPSGAGSGPPRGDMSGTRLLRCQQAVHERYADHLMRQQHRALTGSIYGHPVEAGVRRSSSSALVAAGASAARVGQGQRPSIQTSGLPEPGSSRRGSQQPGSPGATKPILRPSAEYSPLLSPVAPADATIKFS
mmetsp:Transcript_146/g.219  ORF Transcript_146/g.219 Transcript_146/m.219 type:complete len:163 (-) Transcript_146:162-650(-)